MLKRARGDTANRFFRKDFVTTIQGNSAFTVEYDQLVHPVNSGVFPWLSGVSPNYERYRVNGIRFIFESTVSDSMGGANPQLGIVMFYFNADTLDPAPQTKQILLNYAGSQSGKISENQVYAPAFTGKNQDGELFVPETVITEDESDYYWGRIVIATQGCQTTGDIGDLWVEYDVSLITPKLSVGIGLNTRASLITFQNTYGAAGTDWILVPTSAAQFYIRNDYGVVLTNQTITLPSGSFTAVLIDMAWSGTGGATAWTQPTIVLTNCAYFNGIPDIAPAGAGTLISNNFVPNSTFTLGNTCDKAEYSITIRVTDPTQPATIVLSGGNRPTTGATNTCISVRQIDPY